LHTRIIAHRIGDGTVNFYGKAVWDNKKIKEFLELCSYLEIKLWRPVTSDSYGTQKIIIPTQLFEKFAKRHNKNTDRLIKDPRYLLDAISELSEEHRLQTILALIVDDGSSKSWCLTLFEDKNKETTDKVYSLWNSIFPNTARFDDKHITKSGTRVYHIYVKRDGIILLYEKIRDAVQKYGVLAGLWWKEKDLELRYLKATSIRAKQLQETKFLSAGWKENICDHVKIKGSITFREIQKILGLSKDRTRLVLKKLLEDGRIHVIRSGNRAKYSEENIDIKELQKKNNKKPYIYSRLNMQQRSQKIIESSK